MKVVKLLHLGLAVICSVNCSLSSTSKGVSSSSEGSAVNVKWRMMNYYGADNDYGGGGGSSSTSSTSSNSTSSSDTGYNETIEDPAVDNVNNLIKHKVYSTDWWLSFLGVGTWLEYKVTSIKKITGVYARLSSNFYSKDVLNAGQVYESISTSVTYIDTQSTLMSYDIKMNGQVEASLATQASIYGIDSNASINQKVASSFTYNCTYTRSQVTSLNHSFSATLDKTAAKYTDSSHSIAYGLYGTYYVIEGEYSLVQNWWLNNHAVQGTVKFNAVYVPSGLTFGFIYLNNSGELSTKK